MYSVYIPEIFILDFDWFSNKEAREAAFVSLKKSKEINNLNYDSTFNNFFIDNTLYYDYNFKLKCNFNLEILDSLSSIEMFQHWLWLHRNNLFLFLFIYNFIHLYSTKVISKPIFNKYSVSYFKKITWTDIWEINIQNLTIENFIGLSWNLYYKYKLSLLNTWHVLEDRIIILLSILLFII